MLPRFNDARWNVNIFATIFGTVLLILLLRSTVIFDVFGFYYAFSNLFLLAGEKISWLGLVLKFLCALLVGIMLGYIIVVNPSETAKSSAFLAGSFLTWPLYLYWNIFEENKYKYIIVLLYMLYIYSLVYFAGAGSKFGIWLRSRRGESIRHVFSSSSRELLIGIISGALGTVLAAWLQKIYEPE